MSNPAFNIRRARPEEAALLTEITLRSKAHWGYSQPFMEAARPSLTLQPDYIKANSVYLLETGAEVAGYYSLLPKGNNVVELDFLFIDPRYIGQGIGRKLWSHAVKIARQSGYSSMLIEADPNAEAFYQKMGALSVGERESSVIAQFPGRKLPLLEYKL
ncbi:MAG TPA: GNAT family N-acetyltransferase [Chloroflexia bacterium]|nr:GNAT family N-acetyltransferase [Chloroflexia bacterium]